MSQWMAAAMSPPSRRTCSDGWDGSTSKHRLVSSPRIFCVRCLTDFCSRGPGRVSDWRTLKAWLSVHLQSKGERGRGEEEARGRGGEGDETE